MGLTHLTIQLLLALPLVVGAASLTANPPPKRNGLSAYASALRKWGKAHEDGAPASGLAKRLSEELETQSHENDTFYTVNIGVGSPGQTLSVILDTGSSDTWVYWSMTDYGGLGESELPKHYDLADSSTSFHLADAEWSVQYADGSIASGPVALDTLTLGSIQLPNSTIELANASSPTLLSSGSSGVLGLARTLPTSITPYNVPTVKDRLVDAGMTYLTIDLLPGGGSYHLADEVPSDIMWMDSWGLHWSVDVMDFTTGNLWASNDTVTLPPFEGVIDTGTTLLLVPGQHATAYWIEVPEARHDPSQGMWLFPCSQRASLPSLNLNIGAGYEAVIPGEHLDFGSVEGRASEGVHETGPGEDMCYGGVQSSEGLGVEAILGDVFLKSQLVVLGLEDGKIGFGEKSWNSGSSDKDRDHVFTVRRYTPADTRPN